MTVTARLKISDVAALTGLTTHALRYYEREGLMLTPVDRATSTHRQYNDADVAWVQFLTRLRSTGMPIVTIRRYVELARAGEGSEADRLELLLRHRISVLSQLSDITKSLAAIDYKIDLYQKAVSE